MSLRLAFGFDGGGTRTRALLVDEEGKVLGEGAVGATNINIVGFAAALDSLRMAAAQARSQAGLPRAPVDAAFLGLSGIEASGRAPDLERTLYEEGLVNPGGCLIGKDSEAALAGGLSGRPGIVLIAGTGSFCLGRDAAGQVFRCGGWGWLVDDIGGGTYLGREALKAVLLAADGRAPVTSLKGCLLSHSGVEGPGSLNAWIYRQQPFASTLADLAKCVTEEAGKGDRVALGILKAGAHGLAELAARVAFHFAGDEGPELVLAGGLARSGKPYQPLIESAVRSAIPKIRLREPELPPVAGAVLRAFEHTGIPITATVLAHLKTGLEATGSRGR